MNIKEIAEKNKILKIITGSQLYGTDTLDSDTDYSGITIFSEDYYFGIKKSTEEDLSKESKNEDGKNNKYALDYKLYELRNFAILAAANNPNIVEHLFVNKKNILFINEFGQMLLNNSNIFPNKTATNKYIGYASSQKHKMIIKLDNYEQLVAAREFFSEQEPNEFIVMFRDNEEVKSFFKEKGSHFIIGDLNFQKHLMVKKIVRSLNERLDNITNRHELVLKYGFDTKFASHLIRLLTEGKTLLETGRLEFPLPNAELLLQIKKGHYSLKEILKMADDYELQLKEAHDNSKLPEMCDMEKINDLVKNITKQFFGAI